jgi:hypothetical protein
MTVRLIIAGTRHLGFRRIGPDLSEGIPTAADGLALFQRLDDLLDGLEIDAVLTGCADGVDLTGELWADVERIPVEHHPADWKTHGKAAGPIRNQAMVEAATHLLVIRYPDSRGSADVLRRAKRAGLVVVADVVMERGSR